MLQHDRQPPQIYSVVLLLLGRYGRYILPRAGVTELCSPTCSHLLQTILCSLYTGLYSSKWIQQATLPTSKWVWQTTLHSSKWVWQVTLHSSKWI